MESSRATLRHGPRTGLKGTTDAPKSVHSQSSGGKCIMSDKAELPKKKATANLGKLETEDVPSVTPRKRKSGRTADRGPSTHEAGRHAESIPRAAQGRRSDLVSVQSTAPERQRQRPSQTSPAHRRTSMMDMHRPRKSTRPVRTKRATSVPPGPPRTMLQHAWHTVLTSDPLVDSDEECPDEHLRLDYNRRVQVITRLRGRAPTPEPKCSQTIPS
ncbi:hypothetical protein V8E55_000776 [Tylopilus felleus]